MVANESRDAAKFEAAGIVVHDETQERQENVFGHGRAVYSSVTGDSPHRGMGEAMNESEDKSADGQGPDVIQVTVVFDGL